MGDAIRVMVEQGKKKAVAVGVGLARLE